MRDRTILRGTDALRELPDRAGAIFGFPGLPVRFSRCQFGIRKADLELSVDRVELDDVAVLDEADRTADGGLGADMADREKPRVAPEKRPSVMSATLSPMPCP